MQTDRIKKKPRRAVVVFGVGVLASFLLAFAFEAVLAVAWRNDWGVRLLAWEPFVEGREYLVGNLVDPYLTLMVCVLLGSLLYPGPMASLAYLVAGYGGESVAKWAMGLVLPPSVLLPTPTAREVGINMDMPATQWGAILVCSVLVGFVVKSMVPPRSSTHQSTTAGSLGSGNPRESGIRGHP